MIKKQDKKRKNSPKEKSKSKVTSKDAVKKFFNPRSRNELWEGMEYIKDLPLKEKEWMLKFMSEYANATIEDVKDPLIVEYADMNKLGYTRAKNEMIGGGYIPKDEKKNASQNLHKKYQHKKEINDSNNRIRNDIFGVTKINGLLTYDVNSVSEKTDIWFETNPETTEDALIWALDYDRDPIATKKEFKKLKK